LLKREEAEIHTESRSLEGDITVLRNEREDARASVTETNRTLYHRIISKTRNRALAPVVGRKCQGCFVEQPTNDYSTLQIGKEIVLCRQCSRILYVED
jgi:predicted  nucleic acid-binding Zn-ribbon protein